MPDPKVLMIGATGMLGRPVARRLVAEGFTLRALVRDRDRAATLLPGACELVSGDLKDPASIHAALDNIDAVYINLNTAFSAKAKFNPDRDGLSAVIAAIQTTHDGDSTRPVPHVLRLSALGVTEAAGEWWAAEQKTHSDNELMESGLPWTIFRPTWFMESLPLFRLGPFMLRLTTPDAPLYWIAADDFARQVAAALRSDAARNTLYEIHGPEPVSLRDAVHRFARACTHKRLVLPAPRAGLKLAGRMLEEPRYFDRLIDLTYNHVAGDAAPPRYPELPDPTMRIEDYARYMEETGDIPAK